MAVAETELYAEISFVDPATLTVIESELAGLDVTLGNEVHEGVHASLALPISDDFEYISLRAGSTKGEEKEIGIIRHLDDLNDQQKRLVRRELNKRYFVHVIQELISVKEKFGFVYFEAKTNKGLRQFAVRHAYDRVQEYSDFGRVIFDTDNNRYVIPDLRKLTPHESKMFTRHIYW